MNVGYAGKCMNAGCPLHLHFHLHLHLHLGDALGTAWASVYMNVRSAMNAELGENRAA